MLTLDLKRNFLDLSGQLSPENLCCDGELTIRQVNARRKQIMREWKALERKAGQAVTEDETWTWWDEIQADDARILAEIQATTPENWTVVNENVIRHESNCAYVQHWADDKPYVAYSGLRRNLGDDEEIGRAATRNEAIALIRAYFDTLTDEDIQAGLANYQGPEEFELAKTLRN